MHIHLQFVIIQLYSKDTSFEVIAILIQSSQLRIALKIRAIFSFFYISIDIFFIIGVQEIIFDRENLAGMPLPLESKRCSHSSMMSVFFFSPGIHVWDRFLICLLRRDGNNFLFVCDISSATVPTDNYNETYLRTFQEILNPWSGCVLACRFLIQREIRDELFIDYSEQ